MKKLYFIIIEVLITVNMIAQVPQKMSYQCIIRNSGGDMVKNQSIGIRISILQGSTSGIVVYRETYNPNPQTNENGLVTIDIGSGLAITGTFPGINWTNGPYFLKTETDPTGATNYTIAGTSQLLSVPYAFYAKSSETSLDAVKTSGTQTIAGDKTFTGITTVAYPVNGTDAATKAYVDEKLKSLGLIPNNYSGTMTDIDGNTYKTITIGSQTWMAENLKVTRLNDSTAINLVTDNYTWSRLTTPGYCWYNNDASISRTAYGAFYTSWATGIMTKLCPTGWHVPTASDWLSLISTLDSDAGQFTGTVSQIAGGKLKEQGTGNWLSPNQGATNESGFTGLPAGQRTQDGAFANTGTAETWWSSTMAWTITNQNSGVFWGDCCMNAGYSVRCIKN